VILSLLLAATLAQNDARLLNVVSYLGSAEAQLAQTQGNDKPLALLVSASRMVDKCRFGLLGVNLENEGDAARTAWFEGILRPCGVGVVGCEGGSQEGRSEGCAREMDQAGPC
jgi:hypothetical protein